MLSRLRFLDMIARASEIDCGERQHGNQGPNKYASLAFSPVADLHCVHIGVMQR